MGLSEGARNGPPRLALTNVHVQVGAVDDHHSRCKAQGFKPCSDGDDAHEPGFGATGQDQCDQAAERVEDKREHGGGHGWHLAEELNQ